MAAAPSLSIDRLSAARARALKQGGLLLRTPCSRCHAGVVRQEGEDICLTCGWHRPTPQADTVPARHFSPAEAAGGSRCDFRALILLERPDRWHKLLERARKRKDPAAIARYQATVAELTGGDHPEPAPAPAGPLVPRTCPGLGPGAPEVVIHTDGGCKPNPGPGAWACILRTPGWELELAGAARRTTNNRMEMSAALEGLRALKIPSRVTVVTDSDYLFQGMTAWARKWSQQHWTRNGGAIPNAALWQELARAALAHETRWAWTRGHAGQPLNERCDRLASRMIGKHAQPEHRKRSRWDGRFRLVDGRRTTRFYLPPAGG